MNDLTRQITQSHDVSAKVAQLLQTRTKVALDRYAKRVKQAAENQAAVLKANPLLPWQAWISGSQYAVDFAQRSILLAETLRRRGDGVACYRTLSTPKV